MSESFIIDMTREEAHSHADSDTVAVQIRSDHGQTALVQIPLAYFDAVADAAGEPRERATPATPAKEEAAPVAAAPKPTAQRPSAKKRSTATKKPALTCLTCTQ
jgi:hypothetical protein